MVRLLPSLCLRWTECGFSQHVEVMMSFWFTGLKLCPRAAPPQKVQKCGWNFFIFRALLTHGGRGWLQTLLFTLVSFTVFVGKTFIFVCYVTLPRTGGAGWLLLFLDDITGWSLVTNVCFYICNRNFSPIFKNKTVIQFKCRREHLEHQHMIQHRPKATHATAAVLRLIACIHSPFTLFT